MAHKFTVLAQIDGISLDDFKRLAKDIKMHEKVCYRLPAENIEILESDLKGDIFTMKRSYNLDVNIPDIAKKMLKDAFRLQRTDISDLEKMTSKVKLGANLPIEAHCDRHVTGSAHHVEFHLQWTVKVKVPLVGGLLEKHAEGEIRKFSAIEIEIIEDEIRKSLAA